MLLLLVVCILLVLIYVARKAAFLVKGQTAVATFLESELKNIKAAQELPPPTPLAYGWFDDGWPIANVDEKERAPLEHPTPRHSPDTYATQMYIAEYKFMPSGPQRKEFLRRLSTESVSMDPELLDLIYADENAFVRAWVAGHLNTDCKDYSGWTSMADSPQEIRNYEPALLEDPEPIVRAALWSNPKCRRLPWSRFDISDAWKEQFQGMTQLERLGLMRNPELSKYYVVALLETASEELKISRAEHAGVLRAAAVNPNLIWSSRRTGRDAWRVEDHYHPPFKEYGEMWELCLEKWMDDSLVPYSFIKYIQTTSKVKLATYKRLLEKSDGEWLRREVIRSCDLLTDKPVLKLALDDPDKECREIAGERVSRFTEYVGVKEKKIS